MDGKCTPPTSSIIRAVCASFTRRQEYDNRKGRSSVAAGKTTLKLKDELKQAVATAELKR